MNNVNSKEICFHNLFFNSVRMKFYLNKGKILIIQKFSYDDLFKCKKCNFILLMNFTPHGIAILLITLIGGKKEISNYFSLYLYVMILHRFLYVLRKQS